MARLYELSAGLKDLERQAQDFDDPGLEAVIQLAEQDLADKLESYGKVMKNLESDADSLNAESGSFAKEAQRLKDMATVKLNAVKRMKDRIMECMAMLNCDKVDTAHFKFWIQSSGKAPLEITGDVPEEYNKVTYIIDKDKVRADIESGKEVPGARIGEAKRSLRVK